MFYKAKVCTTSACILEVFYMGAGAPAKTKNGKREIACLFFGKRSDLFRILQDLYQPQKTKVREVILSKAGLMKFLNVQAG